MSRPCTASWRSTSCCSRRADRGRTGRQRQRRRAGWSQWLLHNYLFFRVPLLRPDRWLTRWTPRLAFLYGPAFRWLTLAALLAGMWGVSRSWDAFTATLVDMLSWEGLAAYGLTLAAVKTLHEFGHGVTALWLPRADHGRGVPGAWPVAYTDTNEVWKDAPRPAPEGRGGGYRHPTTWSAPWLINASPFMRFDGYFLLSDFLQMPNLAASRWRVRPRERLFARAGAGTLFRQRRRGLILFAWATWIYRRSCSWASRPWSITSSSRPAFLSWWKSWFIARPLWSEIGAWRQRRAIAGSRRPLEPRCC